MPDLSGSKVLVTGAGGFIGGHLCTRLVELGCEVRGVVRYNSRGERGTLDWLPDEVQREIDVRPGDIRDVESVEAATRDVRYVFHLAAQIAIPYSYVNPRDFFETNVLGSLNVARAALDAGVERVVHTSTSEVYGSARVVPITETHPLEPQSPYAASKLGADKLMDSWNRAFELPTVVLRPFNTYGPRQSARAVIPTIISQALAGGTLRLGSLDPKRDMTFVGDTVEGFVAAATAERAVGETIQLGTGEAVSIGEIVEAVGRVLGTELVVELDEARVRPENSEVALLLSDPARARELMGWQPTVSLDEGLQRTIDWIRDNQRRFRIDEYAI